MQNADEKYLLCERKWLFEHNSGLQELDKSFKLIHVADYLTSSKRLDRTSPATRQLLADFATVSCYISGCYVQRALVVVHLHSKYTMKFVPPTVRRQAREYTLSVAKFSKSLHFFVATASQGRHFFHPAFYSR